MRGSGAFRTSVVPGGALVVPWVRNPLWRNARAVPSIDLLLADNKSLVDSVTGQDLITFTRASTATFVGSNGLIQTAASGAARFTHDPATGESLGLLIEEARSNLVLRSEEFANAVWSKLGSTITANSTAAPDGTATADSLMETAVISEHILYYTAAQTFTTNTQSFYVKPNGRNNVALRFFFALNDWVTTVFDLTGDGSITQSSAGSASNFSAVSRAITNAGNGWYRISMTATQPSRSTFTGVVDLCTTPTPTLSSSGSESYLGNATKGVYLWGAQVEAGSIPTSYIPTVASTVTRAAEIATLTGADLTSWYNASAGTVYFRGKSLAAAAIHWSFDDSTANNRITTNASGGGTTSTFTVSVSGTDSCSIASTSFTLGSTIAEASAYALNDFAHTVNGGTVGTDTLGALPVINAARLGSRSSAYLNGTIARFTYWPTRLANSTLQAVTAP